MFNFNTILALSPHPDDAELGAGGLLSHFIEGGKEVYYATFSNCAKSIPQECPDNSLLEECRSSTTSLGIESNKLFFYDFEARCFQDSRQQILDTLIMLSRKLKPDLVLIPSSHDTHQDHEVIHAESLRAFKKCASIWGYEHPWNNLKFETDIFISLKEHHLKAKTRALSHYKTQNFRAYFKKEYIESLALTRGTQIDKPYAETFEVVRLTAEV